MTLEQEQERIIREIVDAMVKRMRRRVAEGKPEQIQNNEAVIEASLDGIVALDSSCKVIEFNPAAELMLGYRRADVIGRDAIDLLAVADRRDNARRVLANCLADCKAELLGRHIETAAIRANGSELPVEMSLTRVQDSPEDAPVLYAFLRDISERRRSQEQLTYLAYRDPLTGRPRVMA